MARANAVFTSEQEVFIVEKFVELKCPVLVKRAFQKKYGNTNQIRKIKNCRFAEVYQRFKENGLSKVDTNPRHQKGADRSDPDKVQVIGDYFIENPFNSINQASVDLKIPYTTINWYLKKKIKMKPYKFSLAQALTAAHKAKRYDFCQWLLSLPNPENFVQLIIFSDEKWFHLTQHPNRQNTRVWAHANPHAVSDTKVQGCAKIQAFVYVVDGKVYPVIWHIDEDGKNVSVNTDRYIQVINEIKENLPPRKIKKFWFMQDGATCHTSKRSREELKKFFGDRIISKHEEIEWPAKSPDLNPLDYSF